MSQVRTLFLIKHEECKKVSSIMNWKAVVWPLGICALVQAHAYGVVLLEGSVKDAFHCPCNRIVLEKITRIFIYSCLSLRREVILPCVPTGSLMRPRRPHLVHTSTGCHYHRIKKHTHMIIRYFFDMMHHKL